MRIIISGGGTGGHLYPAIAVCEELLNRDMPKRLIKSDILFVGTERGIEKRVIPSEGYPIEFLKVEGFVGKSFFKKLRALILFIGSFKRAFSILHKFRPKAVIGSGGYVSLTVTLCAKLEGIPTIALEQNSVPGLSNRILGRFVDAVCVTYEESMGCFPKNKIFHTGNPIRTKILKADLDSAYSIFPVDRQKKTVFVFGGSSGAHSMNMSIIEALPYLLDLRLYLQFIHQTGEADFDLVNEHYRKAGFNALVFKFIDPMAEAYAVSDLLVCRAGATTLSEITAAGKAAILIPYPHAASNHQEKNALRLEAMNAAKVITERTLSGEVLASAIRHLITDDKARQSMAMSSSSLGKPDAAEKVVDILLSLVRNKTGVN